MLVLSRKAGQQLRFGDDIVVTIIEAGPLVRIGIQAPKDVSVWREEVYQRKKAEAAAKPE